MKKYVIKKGKKYVNKSQCSYTTKLDRAHIYDSKKDAHIEIDMNEIIVPVEVTVKELKGN